MKLFEVTNPFDEELPPDKASEYVDKKRRAGTNLSLRPKYSALGNKLINMTSAKDLAAKSKIYRRKNRNLETERYLMLHPAEAVEYAVDTLKGRWPEAEPFIMQNPREAAKYAKKLIGGRWPEAEPYIVKQPDVAADYALFTLNQRWPEAEAAIARKGGYMAAFYAARFIKEGWPELEQTIIEKQQLGAGIIYAEKVMKKRWPEFEKIILDTTGWLVGDEIVDYSIRVIQGRWPEGEQKLLNAEYTSPSSLVKYAIQVIKNRWLEAEPLIAKNEKLFLEYGRKTMGSAKSSQFRQLKKELKTK